LYVIGRINAISAINAKRTILDNNTFLDNKIIFTYMIVTTKADVLSLNLFLAFINGLLCVSAGAYTIIMIMDNRHNIIFITKLISILIAIIGEIINISEEKTRHR
jgi:hypothetical protein